MERTIIILTRLYWTIAALLSLYNMGFSGHPLSVLDWIGDCAVLVTSALCWLSYPWAWMTAGVVGFIILAYQSYVFIMLWLAFTGPSETHYRLNYGPIHIEGFMATLLFWGEPLFGFVVTGLFTYFGAARSDAKHTPNTALKP
jgi:hypothetical protein